MQKRAIKEFLAYMDSIRCKMVFIICYNMKYKIKKKKGYFELNNICFITYIYTQQPVRPFLAGDRSLHS